jgi:hypothetical protein
MPSFTHFLYPLFSVALALVVIPVYGLDSLVRHPQNSTFLAPIESPFTSQNVVSIQHTPFDIGSLHSFLDGDKATVARTPSLNPAEIVFSTKTPVSCRFMRFILIGVPHDLFIAAAASTNDLIQKSGSYSVLYNGPTDENGVLHLLLTNEITASAFHITAQRNGGDDYVHFYAWQFLEPTSVTNITVEYKIRPEHGPEKAIYEPLTESSTRLEDSLLEFRVHAVTDTGETYDISEAADITVSGGTTKRFGEKIHLISPGKVDVSVTAANTTKKGTITVLPRTLKNTKPDIDVLFIERLPRIDFDAENGGWPTNNQRIMWCAHVKNWGTNMVRAPYNWHKNNTQFARGIEYIKPGETKKIYLPTRWSNERTVLLFEIPPLENEFIKGNNSVTFATDALTVGLYVERSYADFFHEHQHELNLDDANSFANWGRRQLRHWNLMLKAARYPYSPKGCTDRVRLDRVVIVPDGALPMNGGLPSNNPNNDDKTVDLIWGFPWKIDQMGDGINLENVRNSISKDGWHWFFIDLALFHELGHARYLIDGYGFDVHTGMPDNRKIRIKDDKGNDILGTYLYDDGIVHWNKYPGLMGGNYHLLSWYDALMYNRVAGQRARGGNYNGPTVIGEFLQDIPDTFYLQFLSTNNVPLKKASVKVYWATRDEGSWYGKFYDNEVDKEYTSNAKGIVKADKFLFAEDGKIIHTYGHANGVPIIRVDYNGETYFTFLEVSTLNMIANSPQKKGVPIIKLRIPLRKKGEKPTPPSPKWQ